ncbi:MAG: 5-formyltetrahydrofolate cyclo-ligase [Oscillospiraceae bacterium]|nr:5-formyltetrahydrofolate cyclo-ligase [Oscillospiraceae bacterium]
MNVQEAISYIEACTWSATRLGLERTRTLLHALGDPQKKLRFIHVAGSNGKGSTCAMLASVLTRAGYRTGLYTSPYIQSFCERIQIDGESIPEEALAAATERVRFYADQMDDHPSQFELVTAIAIEYYAARQCDVVVLEVGMGGALDSTNVIDAPEVAVIMNIGLEHTEYLGSTLEEIARTKGGIIKPGCDCVAYPSAPVVLQTLAALCRSADVPFQVADTDAIVPEDASLRGQQFSFHSWTHLRLPLLGAHQLNNAAVALTVIETLRSRGWRIPDDAVRAGLRDVRWPARMEVLHRDPLFLLDGGHNPQCAEALAQGIAAYLPEQKVTFLLGVLADKDSDTMLDIVQPYGAAYICLTPNNPRALPAQTLAERLCARGQDAVAAPDVDAGIRMALETGAPVVAFGSLYLAGEIRTRFPAVIKRFQRRQALASRDALSPETRANASASLCVNILASPLYQRSKSIFLFRAFGSEADLSAVAAQAEADGKRVCWPCCLSKTEMGAFVPHDERSWKTGAFGIREPDPERSDRIDPCEIDLVLCPCAGFDRFGGRIGMGAGYYDRFLPQCARAVFLLTAFEAQRTARVYTESTDIPIPYLVTEAGLFPVETEDDAT